MPDKAEVVRFFRSGATYAATARQFGISSSRAQQIIAAAVRRERWQRDDPARAELSERSVNCIRWLLGGDRALERPFTAEEVSKIKEADLVRQPNAGAKTVREIKQWLASKGLQLSE